MSKPSTSLATKINRVLVAVIVLICGVLSVVSYRYSLNTHLSELATQNALLLNAVAQNIDNQLAQVEIITSEVAHDADLMKLLTEKRVSKQILSMVFTVSEKLQLSELYLSSLSADMLALSMNDSVLEDYNTLVHEARLNGNESYLTFQQSGALSGWGDTEEATFSLAISGIVLPYYYNIYTGLGTRIGCMRCTVSIQRLFSGLNENMAVMRGSRALYHTGEFVPPKLSGEGWQREGDWLYFTLPLERIDATLVMSEPYGRLRSESQRSALAYTLVILLFGVVLILAMQYMVRRILARLRSLTAAVGALPQDVRGLSLPEGGSDEVGQLASAFNRLLGEASSYYDQLIQKEKDKRKAQSMALQYQINPHFLFNSLYWLQLQMEAQGVSAELTESIEHLGRVLHYNLLGDHEALLSEEREHVLSYVRFVSAMKNFEIHLNVDMPQELEKAHILRFMLQPLLENAIQHGFVQGEPMRIDIVFSIHPEADQFEIAVHNDGKRIPPETLQALRERVRTAMSDGMPTANRATGHGTALNNLARRLALVYEERAVMELSSTQKDTCVRILLPLHRCMEGGAKLENTDRG